jgi:hypothetical protein
MTKEKRIGKNEERKRREEKRRPHAEAQRTQRGKKGCNAMGVR